jgi:hypothetical protein
VSLLWVFSFDFFYLYCSLLRSALILITLNLYFSLILFSNILSMQESTTRTNSMEMSPSWEAVSYAATHQEFPHYRVHKIPPLVPIFNQINPVHTTPSHLRSILKLSRVLVTKTGFGLVIGFIDHLQDVTTNNYYTIADFHTTNHSTLSVLSQVFTW